MNSRFQRWTLVAALGFALLSAPSHAFRMIQNTTVGRVTAGALVTCNAPGGFAHWAASPIDWFLNTAGQGSNKAGAVSTAMGTWSVVPNAAHSVRYAGTTGAGFATDGQNTVVFANGNGCVSPCLAITALNLAAGQVIIESDISFNTQFTWNINGSNQDTQSVAAHEIGHSLGIHHTELTTTPTPTMIATSPGGTGGRTLEADDISALQCSQTRFPPTNPPFTAALSCNGNFRGSTQVSCCVTTNGGCGTPLTYSGWSYSGTANSWSAGGSCAFAYYNAPGCGNSGGSSVNFFSVTVSDFCGNSVFLSAGSLPCF